MSNTDKLRISRELMKITGKHSKLWKYDKAETFRLVEALIAQEVKEARLDENNRLFRKVGLYPDDIASFNNELLGKWFERKLTHSKIEARIDELKGEQVT